MTTKDILSHPFTWGLALGMVFTALALYRVLKLKLEIKRFKRHLSDKLEIEAESMKKIRSEQEALRRENENLRVKNAALNEVPDRKNQRDLEIFARAEKRMMVSVPGFAPVWENAKSAAVSEIEEEESGKSAPKRVFSRWFGTSGKEEKSLPAPENKPAE
ncbi:MAG: hypothetical protein WCH43_12775 [Verrucomicrobiota bacterium]